MQGAATKYTGAMMTWRPGFVEPSLQSHYLY